MVVKKVAVLGAGASGLVALKNSLDEGFETVCFEKTHDIGGLWNYCDKATEGNASVMKTTVVNTSKEIMAFSDYPCAKEIPNFMHNSKLLKYFHDYAKHFKLLDHIRFGVEILKVAKNPDYEETGRWAITIKENGKESTEVFDGVLVATGHYSDKHIPEFPGADKFKGKMMHTHAYRTHKGFEDKRVVIIGIGNSGGDMAVDLSKISKQVYLSTRRGTWVLNRVWAKGQPFDFAGLNRFTEVIPLPLRNIWLEGIVNARFNHADYGLKPNHRINHQHPMVNDELPNRIICGTVVIKPNVERFTETGVVFTDGTTEEDIDIIVFATGYKFGFPFIDDPAFEVKGNKLPMYKYMYPPNFKHHTLAVIGYVQPRGAVNPISEMQSRLALRVFKDNNILPSETDMISEIREKERVMAERYYECQRHTIQVDYIPYLDELAEMAGCRPDLKHLWLTDPLLAFKVFFGPCTPYQFRLMGPGAWSGAREAIMTQHERVAYPLKSRKAAAKGFELQLWHIAVAIVFIAFLMRIF